MGKVTSDKNILDIKEGDKIEFIDEHLTNHKEVSPKFSKRERKLIDEKINDLEATHEEVEFLSSIFVRHKPDGDVRLILNLKDLNSYLNKIQRSRNGDNKNSLSKYN